MHLLVLTAVTPILLAVSVVDARTLRLPDALTLPAAVSALLIGVVAAAQGAPGALIGAACWTAVNLTAFLVGGMGAGDVKLAVPLGALVGWVAAAPGVAVAVVLAQVLTVLWAAAIRRRRCPHGPPMCLAAVTVYGMACAG